MTATVLPFQVFEAPEHWRTVDFISDLHLQEQAPATFAAWHRYMQSTTADAVFILGDLFEVWVGDDAALQHAFLKQCAQILQSTAERTQVAFMRGNRDFLVSPAFLKACGVMDLQDPTVLLFGKQRWLLSHGDEGCLADIDYQAFRRMVRTPQWQADFLAKPLPEREAIARQLRDQSESHKKDPAALYADVDTAWALACLSQTQCTCLLHGHTHQAADHRMGPAPGLMRRVLSDWDAEAAKPRAEVLRWHVNGQVERLHLIQT